MGNSFNLILFLIIVTAVSIFWGRFNRIGYSKFINSIVYFIMKYSNKNTELLRSYLMWFLYMFIGLFLSFVLLVTYQVNLLRFFALDPRYLTLIPLAFIAQSSLTGFMMQLWISAKPRIDAFSELSSILWVKYTLMMPGIMRAIAPLGSSIFEEAFFRGTVFLILINKFPQTGPYFPILVCTVLFVVEQVLQTDTLGQGLILLIGSTSVSVVGCITILSTGSFLPTLLCHAAYAFLYFQMGTSSPRSNPKIQKSKPRSAYPDF